MTDDNTTEDTPDTSAVDEDSDEAKHQIAMDALAAAARLTWVNARPTLKKALAECERANKMLLQFASVKNVDPEIVEAVDNALHEAHEVLKSLRMSRFLWDRMQGGAVEFAKNKADLVAKMAEAEAEGVDVIALNIGVGRDVLALPTTEDKKPTKPN